MPDPQTHPEVAALGLSPQQRAIVESVLAQLVTVASAGAGTGKTHTTVAAVLAAVRVNGAGLDEFALITFTNAAADELRHRLQRAVRERVRGAATPEDREFWEDQEERAASTFVGTIHGFCREIVRAYGYAAEIARGTATQGRTVWQADRAFKRALHDYVESPRRLLMEPPLALPRKRLEDLAKEVWEASRNRGVSPAELLGRTREQPADAGRRYRSHLAALVDRGHRHYEEEQREAHAVDNHDILVRARDLLRGGAAGAGDPRFRYVFVDEFQDTDPVQKEILEALLPSLRALLVVGDPKQAIYGFRGGVAELLETIAHERGVAVLPLNESRRPTRALLGAQNALFGSMGREFREIGDLLQAPPGPDPAADAFPPLLYLEEPDLDARIRRAAELIRERLGRPAYRRRHRESRPVAAGDIAILVRRGHTAAAYEAGLRAHLGGEVEVRSMAGGGFYRRPEIVCTCHMVRLLLHYPDETALSLALLTPYLRGADASAVEQRLLQHGARRGNVLRDWFEAEHRDLARRVGDLRRAVRTQTVPEILESLYRTFAIREYYRGQGDEQAAANLDKLREDVRARLDGEQALTLRQFSRILQSALLGGREEDEAEVLATEDPELPPPYVRIMTVHRSKGLEFPVVIVPEVQSPLRRSPGEFSFVVSADWGLDLHSRSHPQLLASPVYSQRQAAQRRREVEEAMRVLYVAVTRAQNEVILLGAPGRPPRPSTRDFYAWRDEIVRARDPLRRAGARFA